MLVVPRALLPNVYGSLCFGARMLAPLQDVAARRLHFSEAWLCAMTPSIQGSTSRRERRAHPYVHGSVRFGACVLVLLQVAAARSQPSVIRRVRFGAWTLLPLQGPGQMCRVRFGASVLVPMQGAAAGCRCRVLLPNVYGSLRFGACVLVSLQAAAECCCQMFVAVQDLQRGCRCLAANKEFVAIV